MKKLRSHLSLFSRELDLLWLRRVGDILWGLQVELADKFERRMNVSNSAVADEGELLDFDDKGVLSKDEQDEAC